MRIKEGLEYCFAKVSQFQYLEDTVPDNNEEKCEVEQQLAKGSKAVLAMIETIRPKYISRPTNVQTIQLRIMGVEYSHCREDKKVGLEDIKTNYVGVKDEEGNWRRRTDKEVKK